MAARKNTTPVDPFSEDEAQTETTAPAENPWDDDTASYEPEVPPADQKTPAGRAKAAQIATGEIPNPNQKKEGVVTDAEGKVVVTLKAGAAYDAPWIVIHASSLEDAEAQLRNQALKTLMDLTARAATHFGTQFNPTPKKTGPTPPSNSGGGNGGGQQRQSNWGNGGGNRNQGGGNRGGGNWGNKGGGGKRTVNAGDPAPNCDHGEMYYEDGTSKRGNYYEIYKCPQNVCDGVFVNNR